MKEQTVANPTALYLTEADKAIATKVVDTITPITQVNTIFVLGKKTQYSSKYICTTRRFRCAHQRFLAAGINYRR
ncbi:hypothetical protein KRR40_44315 [Niabella defluvii]|nr:hypothetical protein KRR40_44315 [Niabella sp. I65]